MRWDASKVSTKKVILSEQDTCATNTSSAWTSIQADEFLSEGVHEVVINAMDVDNPSLFIGIAAPEYWDQVAAAMAHAPPWEKVREIPLAYASTLAACPSERRPAGPQATRRVGG